MRCTLNRWGTGTCPTPKLTQETKEMDERLKKMQAERESQDKMWNCIETTIIKKDDTFINCILKK